MAKQSKKRGAGCVPRLPQVLGSVGIPLIDGSVYPDCLLSVEALDTSGNPIVGQLWVWSSFSDQAFQRYDSYTNTNLAGEAMPGIRAALGSAGASVTSYVEVRNAQGELLGTSDSVVWDAASS
jgi:hypothetical protein